MVELNDLVIEQGDPLSCLVRKEDHGDGEITDPVRIFELQRPRYRPFSTFFFPFGKVFARLTEYFSNFKRKTNADSMIENAERNELEQRLRTLPLALREEILQEGSVQAFPAGAVLLRAGQYVKVVPLVLDGVIKVFSTFEEKELLLYYIQPEESCIMSFAAVLKNIPSEVEAVAEEDTRALLLPSRRIEDWLRRYPVLNDLFYRQFHLRYQDLLDTIRQLLFVRLDQRLLDYLREKARLKGAAVLELTHREMATELGSAREVITRLLKKLEKEGHIRQLPHGRIEVQ